MTGRRVRTAIGSVFVVLALAVVGALVVQTYNELKREIRGDCAFKWDVADLPKDVHPRNPGLVKLSYDARAAYITKGCEKAGGPPPPPIYYADPPAK